MRIFIIALGLFYAAFGYSQTSENRCLLDKIKSKQDQVTVAELRKSCSQEKKKDRKQGALSRRIEEERNTEFNPYIITPHRMNYILAYAKTDNINRDVYAGIEDFAARLKEEEVKFQFSFKIPLSRGKTFIEGDRFYFGMTLKSFWQLYSDDISAPFRETNYRPEFFYSMPLKWQPNNANTSLVIGVEHESNGRALPLSRSWNRAYVGFLYEKDNFVLAFRPWYRLEEDPKQSPDDPGGDDNPDIEDFMGKYEISSAYQWKEYEVNFLGRRNFRTDNGAVEIGFTFPLTGRLRGYLQYFNGYGESLIDYNHSQERIGIGLALTDML